MRVPLSTATGPGRLSFAWLEVTGRCQLECVHCYADSSPLGTHGTMTAEDWERTIDQLVELGTDGIQFIGGEPTAYPQLGRLIAHARKRGMEGIEVFSNLLHISAALWDTFKAHGVDLATSYYSDEAIDHDTVTGRTGSHRRTRANIAKALDLGLNLRGGIIRVRQGQRVSQAHQELTTLGLAHIGADRTRAFGRAGRGTAPTIDDLCGHCAHEKIAVLPDGSVVPCVLGRFITVGNVRQTSLAAIWNGPRLHAARQDIESAHSGGAQACTPPQFLPMCGPCNPCVPSVQHCDPRADSGPVA
ncbi:radical SAM protein [Streptomyces uncialis]|uniref:radical SAM protein n=1 Tax=Streptomyces uncialis TaxID=1048205 RepID=UPI0038684768|nr:radical SAM protein [Streptomyces uncialis]